MTNFDYLKKEDEFKSFIDIAIVAEKTYRIDSNTCIMNCRRAMEAAIKWMYSVDDELTLPYKDNIDIAIVAEKTYRIDSNTCIMNCRRAMEAAIKWMYSVDDELTLPYKDNLHTLMSCDSFRNIIDRDLYRRLEFIRTYGNDAAHNSGEKAKKIAEV